MPMLTTDRIGGSALCLLALFVMWESRTLPLGTWRNPGPGYVPVRFTPGACIPLPAVSAG